ncbi:MAG: hypothetical protein Q9167_002792 [Letrouitia subvulpina]
MATSIPPWSPPEVLIVHPGKHQSCVGDNVDGESCDNSINKENRKKARSILQKMGKRNFYSEDFERHLKQLANCLLCQAKHVKEPTQHAAIVSKWKNNIAEFRASSAQQSRDAATHPTATDEPTLRDELGSLSQAVAALSERFENSLQFTICAGIAPPSNPTYSRRRANSNPYVRDRLRP